MDELQDTIDARTLHLVKLNQTSPLYDVVDRNGALLVNWSMDSFIELIQKFYHQMGFQSKLKICFKHSAHDMLKNKSHRFLQETYTKGVMQMMSDTWSVDRVMEYLKKS